VEKLLGLDAVTGFLLAVTPVVHTTGINVSATIAIVASVVTIMTVVFGVLARSIGNQITRAINELRIEVINKLDIRLTRLEVIANATRDRQVRDDE
jgi:hypothetical protein